eukprot:scaffold131640_cov26-Tisochrysis_lutea.AAC.2
MESSDSMVASSSGSCTGPCMSGGIPPSDAPMAAASLAACKKSSLGRLGRRRAMIDSLRSSIGACHS